MGFRIWQVGNIAGETSMIIETVKIGERSLTTCLFAIMFTLILLIYGVELNLPNVLLLFVALLIVILGNDNATIGMVLSCIPLYNCFSYSYIVLIASAVLIIKNFSKIRIGIHILPIFLIFIWELLHSFDDVVNIKQLVILIVPYLFITVLFSYKKALFDYSYCVRIFSISTICMCMTLIINVVMNYGGSFLYALSQMSRLGMDEELSDSVLGMINPNSLGVICVFAITGLMQKYFFIKKEKIDIVLIITLILFGTFTLSRTYVVCLAVVIILFIIEKKDGIKDHLKALLASIGFIGVGLIVTLKLFPNTLTAFIDRWQQEDISGGRLEIMRNCSDYIWSHPEVYIKGIGSQDYTYKVEQLVPVAPHDGFNEILMIWGIPGLIIIISLIFIMILNAKKRCKTSSLVNYIPLIVLLVKGLAGHWITSGYTMLTFSFVYLSLCNDFHHVISLQKEDMKSLLSTKNNTKPQDEFLKI